MNMFPKTDTAFFMVSLDVFLVMLIIDAKEDGDMAVADIAGVYLYVEMDDFTTMQINRDKVKIMC